MSTRELVRSDAFVSISAINQRTCSLPYIKQAPSSLLRHFQIWILIRI